MLFRSLKDPRLIITQLGGPTPQAEVTLVSAAPASAILELLDQEPLGLARSAALEPGAIEGRGETSIKRNR